MSFQILNPWFHLEVSQTEDVLGDGNEQIDQPIDHIQIDSTVEVCETEHELGHQDKEINTPVEHLKKVNL